MAKVKVCFFRGYDIASDRTLESKRPATLETIKHVNGVPNMARCYMVEKSQLDVDGFFAGQIVDGSPSA